MTRDTITIYTGDTFFSGLVERAKYYEQFENRTLTDERIPCQHP
jgi:hypothetical protein